MKRVNAMLLLFGLTLGLLMPSMVVAVDNNMIMKGPGGGGGGGNITPEPTEIVYHTGTGDKWAVIIGISDYDGSSSDLTNGRPSVIAEQPDSCPVLLDNLGVPFYVK